MSGGKKSYIAVVQYQDRTYQEYFTSRARLRSEKVIAQADKWTADILRQHGTTAVRVTIAEVIWSITG